MIYVKMPGNEGAAHGMIFEGLYDKECLVTKESFFYFLWPSQKCNDSGVYAKHFAIDSEWEKADLTQPLYSYLPTMDHRGIRLINNSICEYY